MCLGAETLVAGELASVARAVIIVDTWPLAGSMRTGVGEANHPH
jgi:hypothetical protein